VNWQVMIRPRAEEDIRKAQLWYERQQPGLGGHFIDEVSRAIKTLEVDADRFSLYYRNFRRILLPRFPYKLFYLLDGKRAIVFESFTPNAGTCLYFPVPGTNRPFTPSIGFNRFQGWSVCR
jgi:hypothetical protein